jgi:hypothetical protein
MQGDARPTEGRMVISKRNAITTLCYVAADLGLDVRGRFGRRSHAEGRFNGVDILVELVPASAESDGAGGRSGWLVRANSSHRDLGGGIRIERAKVPPDEREQENLVLTDDDEFDAVVHVSAEDRNHAHRMLGSGTRTVIQAFFESGVEATITDRTIDIAPQATARALSSRLRNAARMSRLLEQRIAELA